MVGGETCSDGYSPENNCSPAGIADTDLRKLHCSYLNNDYNNEVNNDWEDGGSMEAIKKNLGYRFVLNQGKYSTEVAGKGKLKVDIELKNIGYAASMHDRNVNLILWNSARGEVTSLPFDTDTRLWFAEVSSNQSFPLPESLTKREYDLFLQVADGNESLAGRPEYCVRFANPQVWMAETGYNDLNHKIKIN